MLAVGPHSKGATGLGFVSVSFISYYPLCLLGITGIFFISKHHSEMLVWQTRGEAVLSWAIIQPWQLLNSRVCCQSSSTPLRGADLSCHLLSLAHRQRRKWLHTCHVCHACESGNTPEEYWDVIHSICAFQNQGGEKGWEASLEPFHCTDFLILWEVEVQSKPFWSTRSLTWAGLIRQTIWIYKLIFRQMR